MGGRCSLDFKEGARETRGEERAEGRGAKLIGSIMVREVVLVPWLILLGPLLGISTLRAGIPVVWALRRTERASLVATRRVLAVVGEEARIILSSWLGSA